MLVWAGRLRPIPSRTCCICKTLANSCTCTPNTNITGNCIPKCRHVGRQPRIVLTYMLNTRSFMHYQMLHTAHQHSTTSTTYHTMLHANLGGILSVKVATRDGELSFGQHHLQLKTKQNRVKGYEHKLATFYFLNTSSLCSCCSHIRQLYQYNNYDDNN